MGRGQQGWGNMALRSGNGQKRGNQKNLKHELQWLPKQYIGVPIITIILTLRVETALT